MKKNKLLYFLPTALVLSLVTYFAWSYSSNNSAPAPALSSTSADYFPLKSAPKDVPLGQCLMGPYSASYKGYYKSMHLGSDSESLTLNDKNQYVFKSDINAGFLFYHLRYFNESQGVFDDQVITPTKSTVFSSQTKKTVTFALNKGNVDIEAIILKARRKLLSGDASPLHLVVQKDASGATYTVDIKLKDLPVMQMSTVLSSHTKVVQLSYTNHHGFKFVFSLAPNYLYFPVQVVQYKPDGSVQIVLKLDHVNLVKSNYCMYRQSIQ